MPNYPNKQNRKQAQNIKSWYTQKCQVPGIIQCLAKVISISKSK